MERKYLGIIVFILLLLTLLSDYYAGQVASVKSQLKSLEGKYLHLLSQNNALQSELNRSSANLRNRIDGLKTETQLLYNTYSGLKALEYVLRVSPENKLPLFVGLPFAHFKCNDAENILLRDSGIAESNAISNNPLRNLAVAGQIGGGLKFNGTDDCINIDKLQKNIAYDTEGAWSFWVRRIKGGEGEIISLGDQDTDSHFSIEMTKNGECYFGFAGGQGGPSWYAHAGVFKAINEWIHIAIVQDGKESKIYKNGEKIDMSYEIHKDSNKGKWYFDYQNFDNGRIGCTNFANQGNSLFYGGYIDDVRYYKRVLSQKEIKAVYNGGSGTEESVIIYVEP